MTRCFSICAVFFVAFTASANAAVVDVFLIGGQSNASGRGNAADIPAGSPLASPQTDVEFFWRKTFVTPIGTLTQNAIVDLQPGSGHGNENSLPGPNTVQFGSELSFGRTIADARPGRNALIIKYGHGGSDLRNLWSSTGQRYLDFVDVVGDALSAVTARGDTYNLQGMAWLQGESDANSLLGPAAYQANLEDLILRVRDDIFEGEAAPFILTRLSDNQYEADISTLNGVQLVRAAQTNIANVLENVAFIDTDDDLLFTTYPPGTSDIIHFDANGQINLGNAIGQQMLAMTVPEPGSAILLAMGGSLLALRRRRSTAR